MCNCGGPSTRQKRHVQSIFAAANLRWVGIRQTCGVRGLEHMQFALHMVPWAIFTVRNSELWPRTTCRAFAGTMRTARCRHTLKGRLQAENWRCEYFQTHAHSTSMASAVWTASSLVMAVLFALATLAQVRAAPLLGRQAVIAAGH